MFKTYTTCNNTEFYKLIRNEYQKWITGRLKIDYNLKDLIKTVTPLFNNKIPEINQDFFRQY